VTLWTGYNMSDIALKVENLTKEYRLGTIGHGTLREDLQSLFAKMRGQEDPNSLVTAKHNIESDKKHFLALDNINFEIKKGDRVGIIGKNGAGKSTLLKVLSRITAPTKGNIYINGRIGSLLEVGTGFHPELSGRENIYLSGSIMGMKKHEIDKKLDEIIDFSGVEKFIDTPVKRYSSGMFVRLGFAVAAHLEPDILIVDEVLAVGDAEFQKKAIGKMQDVSTNDGRTVLFVSHNMVSVRKLCDKSIFLENGNIIDFETTSTILNRYLKPISHKNLSEKKWDVGHMPKTDCLAIEKIEIRTSAGEMTNRISLSKDFLIKVDFEVFHKTEVLFSLILWSENGECLFGSLSNVTENDKLINKIDIGYHSVLCHFPGNLLNDMNYSFSLVTISKEDGKSITLEHVLGIEGIEDGKLRRNYTGNFGGLLRPKLEWELL
jgi:lipopolysaccharide transport system ATP-binding protein